MVGILWETINFFIQRTVHFVGEENVAELRSCSSRFGLFLLRNVLKYLKMGVQYNIYVTNIGPKMLYFSDINE